MPTEDNEQDYQHQLRELINQSGVSQAKAAALIAEHTSRPCSPRTVRAWLADMSVPSSRPCPVWAVNALRAALTPSDEAA